MTPLAFAKLMQYELDSNAYKGDWSAWKPSLHEAIYELSYHQAKLVIALRKNDCVHVTEHAGDLGNILSKMVEFFGESEGDEQGCGTARVVAVGESQEPSASAEQSASEPITTSAAATNATASKPPSMPQSAPSSERRDAPAPAATDVAFAKLDDRLKDAYWDNYHGHCPECRKLNTLMFGVVVANDPDLELWFCSVECMRAFENVTNGGRA